MPILSYPIASSHAYPNPTLYTYTISAASTVAGFHEWLQSTYRFGFAYFLPPRGIKRRRPEQLARSWVAHLLRLGVLSLRDPLAPADNSRAAPCRLDLAQPTLRLACQGHVSWRARSS